MKIAEILSINSIEVNINIKTKEELLDRLIQLAYNSGHISDLDLASEEVYKREKIMSTGVGKGIALPHAKTNAVSQTVGALIVLDKSIDFDSLDGEQINIALLLLGRENNVGNHLKLLSKISRLMNNDSFRERLIQSQTPEDTLELFKEVEDLD